VLSQWVLHLLGKPGAEWNRDLARSRVNGTRVDPTFINGIPQPAGLAVNATWIYWAEFAKPTAVGGGGLIGRAKLNGIGVNRKFITGASSPAGIALDGRTVAR
jgi:hypothetical protein